MEINSQKNSNLQQDLIDLLKAIEEEINGVIATREAMEKGLLEQSKATLMGNLSQIEGSLRASRTMMNRCLVHFKRNEQDIRGKDGDDSDRVAKERYSKIEVAKKTTWDKEDNETLHESHTQSNKNHKNRHCANTNAHDTSEMGSIYLNAIKPKLNFTYNSEEELFAIMHHDTFKAIKDNVSPQQKELSHEGSHFGLKEPTKDQIFNSKDKEHKPKGELKQYVDPMKLELTKSNQFNPKHKYERDSKVINEQHQLNVSNDDDEYNAKRDIEDDTLTKLIIQDNGGIDPNINPIDTASKIKSKATKVAQLVTLISSNPDLFELLSQLFQTDDIIDLLLAEDVDENLIDSISVSIEEIERLKMIDENNHYNAQLPYNNQSPLSQIEEEQPSNSNQHLKSTRFVIESNGPDFPKDNLTTSNKPNKRQHSHKKVTSSLNKGICNTNKKQRKRTKINLISCSSQKNPQKKYLEV